MLEHVLEEIQLAEVVGLDVLVLDATPEHPVALFLDAFLIQVETTGEKCDLENKMELV